ncbi:hypothetical protein SK128_004798 [Halocaridina rubra]|uniref:TOG domain-containing protein n=1 Tax=Halocaridina rubra TaxID=373956 RepID=A0AAN8X9S7_HALRR
MKKFVTDSNAVAQEKALEAVLAFVENAHIASRTAGDVTIGIVQKCLAAPKRGTQDKSLEVILMYCEIEKYEVLQEELMKGFTQKHPKVVAACVKAVTTALRDFGPKVINPKPLMKQMHTLLEDRDKTVREESKKLVIELYKWIGQALKQQMSSIKPIQIQELEAEFEKLGNEKTVQTRFLRSQQELKAKMEAQGEEEKEGGEEEDEVPEIDVYDLLTPLDILSKLPKDFYEKMEDKKWKERKEAVDILLPLTQSPRLEMWMGAEDMARAFEQKNPKIQEVALKWMSDAILEFGFILQPMTLISDIKKALAHTNLGVRTAGISLCGTIYLYMGAALRVFFVDEKPALLHQIDEEFEKKSHETAPAPSRGLKHTGSTENDGDIEPDNVDTGQQNLNAQDMIPRVNISEQLASNLFSELADKNWKVRNEALHKVSNILTDAKFIKGDIDELPAALCSQMNDSNKNIAIEALRITALLSTALGPNCKPHTRTIVPGMLTALGDSKQNIRQEALSTLNSWVEQTGLKEVWDEEVFVDALKTGPITC